MLVRAVRDDDWEGCLEIDTSYETEFAWQMDEVHSGKEWHVSFREIHLPRTLRIESGISSEHLLKSWQNRDQFWVAIEHREVIGYLGLDVDMARYQARVMDLAVAPQHRRQGAASGSLPAPRNGASASTSTNSSLCAHSRPIPAISFANKHRFAFCGFQDSYWPGQEVALFFRQRVR